MTPKVLFSDVQGVVVRNGTPISGATIQRKYVWGESTEGTDQTVTDASGKFALPKMTGQSLLSFLPHEPVIQQTLTIEVENVPYPAWAYIKRNYDLNGELGGKPLQLYCELTKEPRRVVVGPNNVGYFGLCELR